MLLSWVSVGEMLSGITESSNIMDKYVVAVQDKDKKLVGHLPLRKSGKCAKTIFHFLKADKNHSCEISVTEKAANAGDGLGIKVPCRLFFIAKEKCINILQEKFSVLL